jgi:transposase
VSAGLDKAWAGIDVGKRHHWVCVVDPDGRQLLSAKVANGEAEISAVIGSVTRLAREIAWAVDIVGAPSALLLALLGAARQPVRYASGQLVAAMSGAYAGEGKTDPKDTFVIAETCRLRRGLPVIDHKTDLVRDLSLLTAHRTDLIADRVRMINRLRDVLTSVFPALEQEFDFAACKGALVLLTGYGTPARLRQAGEARLASWLRQRRVRGYAGVAARAIAAARSQRIALPGQDLAAGIVAELARNVLALDQRVAKLDKQIGAVLADHPQAEVIQSMPGFGPILVAMLLATAGDMAAFPTAGHLAAAAGLVPVPNDSGRRAGKLHKPRRYSRPLRHAMYLSAQTSMMREGPGRDYYLKKRDHGRTHQQAVIALARRRTDVLWALLRDNRTYAATPPAAALAA